MDGLWEKANEVSEVGYKIHSAAMIVELVATNVKDNAESGALWAALEILLAHSDRLECIASEIMTMNRQHEESLSKTVKTQKTGKTKK